MIVYLILNIQKFYISISSLKPNTMRKISSRSFAEKQSFPSCLPPLQKKNTNTEEAQVKNMCPTTRPTAFIIRKKNSSFMQACTTRRQPQAIQQKQNSYKNEALRAANEGVLKPKVRIQSCKNKGKIKQQIQNNEVSICKIQIQQFVAHQNGTFKKQQKIKIEQASRDGDSDKIMQNISTAKSLIKKGSKKRKIQECKTRKINWGSKNPVFDLKISAIQINQNQNLNTPLESLQQLYIQMF